jgi:outer membrane protein assembly factor BamD (BamD/ComL family)
VLLKRTRREAQAFVLDSYGFYYYRRRKYHAALSYVQRAMRIHATHHNWAHVAACQLHSSCVLAKLDNRAADGLHCMAQVRARQQPWRTRCAC